ncbi:MAG TPA: hypothetical protein VGO55_07410 [Allosphingosinicella sp.]|jgi:hypothetical protein|nr:hypothetical protein [Allosphingosinicella sp.]
MTDLDLDRLGDVWRQQPDAAEMERLRRTAAAVSRRARLARVVDIGAGLAVAAVVILIVLSNPKVGTFLLGGAAILLMLGSHIRLRNLRQIELKSLSGSTEDMLDQTIERIETTLKQNRLSLIAIGPAVLMGLLVSSTADRDGIGRLFPILRDIPLSRPMWSGLAAIVLAIVAVVIALGIRRGRRELERLRAMREAYRHEHESATR